MKLRIALVMTLAVLGLFAWSQRASETSAELGQPSLVWWLDNPAQVSGAVVPDAYSVLQRGYYSVAISIHTSGLTPDHAYTLWYVVFQNPRSCSGNCGEDDINAVLIGGPNPVGIGVHYGGSMIAPESGKADIGSRLLEDTTETCATVLPYSKLCTPMRDSATAEVMVFLLDNGPASSAASIDAFDDGCRRMVWFGYVVADYASTGFDCYRAQSTYHRP
jgi:hypothetical protein